MTELKKLNGIPEGIHISSSSEKKVDGSYLSLNITFKRKSTNEDFSPVSVFKGKRKVWSKGKDFTNTLIAVDGILIIASFSDEEKVLEEVVILNFLNQDIEPGAEITAAIKPLVRAKLKLSRIEFTEAETEHNQKVVGCFLCKKAKEIERRETARTKRRRRQKALVDRVNNRECIKVFQNGQAHWVVPVQCQEARYLKGGTEGVIVRKFNGAGRPLGLVRLITGTGVVGRKSFKTKFPGEGPPTWI